MIHFDLVFVHKMCGLQSRPILCLWIALVPLTEKVICFPLVVFALLSKMCWIYLCGSISEFSVVWH